MSINNENSIEPVTELGFALSYSNQCMLRRFMSDDPGAGANAGSGINMTFVSNPLSELVWSPLKGPRNVALLPANRITTSRNFAIHNKLIDEEDFLTQSTPFQMKGVGQVAGKDDASGMFHGSGGRITPVHGTIREDEKGTCVDFGETNTAGCASVSLINPDERIEGGENQALVMDFSLTSAAQHVNETKACRGAIADRLFHGGKHSEKMESTSENDLPNIRTENVPPNETLVLELPQKAKESLQTDMATMDKPSAIKSRVHVNRRKRKEKALSDGDANGMMSKENDDSHESVESCNSAGLFATGKRRRSFKEGLVSGSKGFKKMRCDQGSTPVAKRDSSFMNWISNLMKGFSQSVQEEAPFPISAASPRDEPEDPDQRRVSFNKNQEPGAKIIGFQSIFQSLYCSKAWSKELELLNKTSNNDAVDPDGNSGKPFLSLNEQFDESTSGNEDNSAMQSKALLDVSGCSRGKGKTNSQDNNDDNNSKLDLELSTKRKEKMDSDSSPVRVDSDSQSAGRKTTSKFCHRKDPLGSFWITRFSPKTPGSSSNPDHVKHNTSLISPKPYTECVKLIPRNADSAVSEGRDHSAADPVPLSRKELKSMAVRINGPNDPMSLNKLNPILPFSVSKRSDAMASVFARRLDDLKHVTSLGVSSGMTCFFCGAKGHNLRDCSEVTEIELQELLRNLHTYSGVEEPTCLCIRCFQQNHWAISCPKASSTKHLEMESSFEEMQINLVSGNKENSKIVVDSSTKTAFNWKANEATPLKENKRYTSRVHKHDASSFVDNTSGENQIVPLPFFAAEENPAVARGLFDVVRRLRLSRSDIMKWMNSRASASLIEGFFLRLRLGKWEEGLGGTGYHVACIVGTRNDNKQKGSGNSLLVEVGGLKCLVESRYISNNDFLEDELMAWWCVSSRTGDKIPSEEDLRMKLKSKSMLGF